MPFKIFYPQFPSTFFHPHFPAAFFYPLFHLSILSSFFHPPSAAIRSAFYKYRTTWTHRVAICKCAPAGWNFNFVVKEVFPLSNCYYYEIYPITAFHNYKMTRKHTFSDLCLQWQDKDWSGAARNGIYRKGKLSEVFYISIETWKQHFERALAFIYFKPLFVEKKVSVNESLFRTGRAVEASAPSPNFRYKKYRK